MSNFLEYCSKCKKFYNKEEFGFIMCLKCEKVKNKSNDEYWKNKTLEVDDENNIHVRKF